MKVLYLYTEVMGYNIPIFEELVTRYGATVDVVHWDQNKKTPYTPNVQSDAVRFHRRSDFSPESLRDFVIKIEPDLVYTSGWQDKGYRPSLAALKALDVPIVMGLDSQWNGSLRQWFGSKIIKYLFKRRYFSYAWVPGPLQHACALRLGFTNAEIISHLLTGDTPIFNQAALALDEEKTQAYPKQFLYVGRLTESKGVDTLAAAFRKYKDSYCGDWGLTCVGNGPLEEQLRAHPDITIKPFAAQTSLASIASCSGALVVPSRYEPWGVVVHEFATAGLPLILSDAVGARRQFLVDGFNGFEFTAGSVDDLARSMLEMSSQSDKQQLEMARGSRVLAAALSPEIATASFVSILIKSRHLSRGRNAAN